MLLPAETCRSLAAPYDQDKLFRNCIIMEHRAYGRGEDEYFCYALPNLVAGLHATVYPPLAAQPTN